MYFKFKANYSIFKFPPSTATVQLLYVYTCQMTLRWIINPLENIRLEDPFEYLK